ncbi:hypothetical protein AG4045_027379 [Apium graveolens]|uniref:Protein kinase domain-containing protein n=1 Tax=Apium graveolens TaxID=4045 RepID=A0A6L5B8T0_APIGR|nr:hypothetical protein AG4045_027379 [Apium graveolens]
MTIVEKYDPSELAQIPKPRLGEGTLAIVEKYDPSELAQIPKPRLGEGTLGTLYKAVHKFGSTVTIRKIRPEVASSDDFEFWIKFFGGLQNDSIAKLIFSFWYGGEAFVVHEYFCLGSLEELLHGTEGIQYTPLTWKIRQQIALDAAKAVTAVHKQVIANVTNLGEYIKEKKRREGLEGIPDKRMVDVNPNLAAFIGIARLCLRNDPKARPSMDQVVEMIHDLE